MQTSAFEVYVLGLLAILEHLPIPIAIAFDRSCERVQGNRAFRCLTGLSTTENASMTLPMERRTRRYRITIAGIEPDVDEFPMRRTAREGTEIVDVAMRIERHDGAAFEVIASAWPLRDPNGAVEGSIGVFVDVTQSAQAESRAQQALEALAESERRYRLITEAMPEFVWLDATDGSAIYSNKRWLDYTGLTQEQNAGFGWQNIVHPDDLKRLEDERLRTLETGQAYEGECRYRGRDGKYRWFLFGSIPVNDENGVRTTWLGTATDIDKQKRAEAQQAFFATASDVLGSTLDVASTLSRIALLAIDSLGTWCQIDFPDAENRLRVAVVAHSDPAKQAFLETLVDSAIYNENAQTGPPHVFATRRPLLLQRVHEQAVEHVVPAPEHRDIYKRVGYEGGLMVPLMSGDRILGVLGIASDDPTRLYTEFDIATALELGRRGASALENARSFARERRVATTLQRALLPSALPASDRVQFSSAYAAAASALGEAVGGDWYDAFALDGERIAVSMGDVAGHGVDAAVTMATVRQAIRAGALANRKPKDVLACADGVLRLESASPMITALFGVYDIRTREFVYAVCGHPRPLLVTDGGELTELGGEGAPLGEAFDPALLQDRSLIVPSGATIVFYTDGLIEYDRNISRAVSRLEDVVRDRFFLHEQQPAQAIIDAVLDGPQSDDIAVLVMRLADPDTARLRVTMRAVGPAAAMLRTRLRDFAKAACLTDDELFRVLSAGGEAIANAIEHAYAPGNSGPITVSAWREHGAFTVEVADRGMWRKAGEGTGSTRGRGISLMESMAAQVHVDRSSPGTVIRLVFT